MAVDGMYSIEVQSPMGVQKGKVTLVSDGDTLSGTFSGQAGEQPIENGSVTGDTFSFPVTMNAPMGEIMLVFSGTVTGDDVSGQVQAGSFGAFPFKGVRE